MMGSGVAWMIEHDYLSLSRVYFHDSQSRTKEAEKVFHGGGIGVGVQVFIQKREDGAAWQS